MICNLGDVPLITEDEAICQDIDAALVARRLARKNEYDAEGNYRSGYTRHGHSRVGGPSPEYSVWRGMTSRCRNPKSTGYHNYGGRGIKVCERWQLFDNFLADMGEKPEGMTLERIDSNGDYEPGNCRWATYAEQARNKHNNINITINKTSKCLTDWAAFAGISVETVISRLRVGWEPWLAIFYPPMPRGVSRWHPPSLESRKETAAIRRAILTVLDDGDPTLKEPGEIHGKAYAFYHPFESIADDARVRFVEAVIAKLRSEHV
jgi:hypothetical protein